MSGLVAIFNRDGADVDPVIPPTMLAARPERGPDGAGVVIDGPVAMAHQQFHLLPEDCGETQPLILGGLLFAGDCRLDNRQELAHELGLDARDAAALSDAKLLQLSYQAWGERCPEKLLGDFAFVVWDAAKAQLFAARDAMGARDLCYYVDDRVILVASEISQLLAHPAVIARINEDRVAAFLSHLWDRPGETFYRDIHYLAPAHALKATADRVDQWRYWDVKPNPIRFRNERDYAERYRELLAEVVACRLRSIGPVGLSLSGGLDSTTIAALAAPMLPAATGQQRLKSFSYSFDEFVSCDEREYIRPIVEQYNLDPVYLPCDGYWTLKELPEWPTSRDFVLADAYAQLPASVMRSAQSAGIRMLLAGYYGDSLMTGEHYWALDMIRDGKFALLGRVLRDNYRTIGWRRSFVDFGLRRMIPSGVVNAYRRVRPRLPVGAAPGIHDELIARSNLQERLSPPVLGSGYPPGFQQRYQTLLGSDYSQGFASVRHQYNRHGIELISPFFDRRLVEYTLNVPGYVLGRPGGMSRRLHREAMVGLLPEEIRMRRRASNFSPLMMKGLQDKEKETVRALFARPQVVERGYVRADWLAQAVEREFDQSPDSVMLWLVISLELWLQRFWS